MKTLKFKHYFFMYGAFLTCLFSSRAIYAYVFDVDYFGPEAQFQLEGKGREFCEWANDVAEREERRDQWVAEVAKEIGYEFAACWDGRLGERE